MPMKTEPANELVSVIIPCYNGEKTIVRCLDSLLAQSWSHLEVIFVNNGSTDHSAEIAGLYRKRFQDAGMKYAYVEQKNGGLGSAINAGLKNVTGSYLCWGDVDDFWLKDSILIRKRFLDENLEYGSVSSDAYIYDEADLSTPCGLASERATNLEDENQFMNHLLGSPLYTSGCHMLRMSAFLDANPGKSIYPSRHGQNNQLLMPVYYKYKHKFLPVPLYGYVVSAESMSHKVIDKKKEKERIIEYYHLMKMTIKGIAMSEKEKRKYLIMNERRKMDSLIDFYAKHRDKMRVILCHAIKKLYGFNI